MPKPPDTRDELLSRTVAGKYEIRQLLSTGGMGNVYRARHAKLRIDVALKLLRPDKQADEIHVRRFEREARRAAGLNHPNIVQVRDFGVDPEAGPYVEMELLQGMTLRELIAHHGALPVDLATSIGADVLEALMVAHEAGLVHRDIKPENIFLSHLGGRYWTKLLDFGIARVFSDELHSVTDSYTDALTHTGIVLGTLSYMSPEQIQGSRELDPRTDLFSTGATLFEMLTGTRIVDRPSFVESAAAVLDGSYLRSPASVRPSVPEGLDAAVARSLEFDREARFPNAGLMLEALEAHVGDRREARAKLIELAEGMFKAVILDHAHRPTDTGEAALLDATIADGKAMRRAMDAIATSSIRVAPLDSGPEAEPVSRSRPEGEGGAERRSGSSAELNPEASRTRGPPAEPIFPRIPRGTLNPFLLGAASALLLLALLYLLLGSPGF
ncbi:MAG: serine/threonine protein kinase [Myxococcales bacterium]|nr:serine/threonine protein kinase [Myxococcales bacterium]